MHKYGNHLNFFLLLCDSNALDLIFVDDYMEALQKLNVTVTKAHKVNPEITFEVFIHKVDGLSDEHKIETQRDIHRACDRRARGEC